MWLPFIFDINVLIFIYLYKMQGREQQAIGGGEGINLGFFLCIFIFYEITVDVSECLPYC